jgi:hypothetical protein
VCTVNELPWQVYFLVCTVNKFPLTSLLSRVYSQQVSLTSLLSRVYSQQVFLDKFTFSCIQSTRFPWQVYFLVCTGSTSFPWHVYFLVCIVNKFSLTSLLSRLYSQQVFLDKFTFSCIQSTSFPWQVYFLVCTVNKFSLTSLLSRVYGQQAFLDKFSLTNFVARVRGMLLNIYLTSRLPFVCQNHRSIFRTLGKFSLATLHTNRFSLFKSWHD